MIEKIDFNWPLMAHTYALYKRLRGYAVTIEYIPDIAPTGLFWLGQYNGDCSERIFDTQGEMRA